MKVEVPVQFLADWIPNLPPASELSSAIAAVDANPFTKAASREAMEWAQHAQGRLVSQIQAQGLELPPGVASASTQVFSIGFSFAGAKTKEDMVNAAIGAVEDFTTIMETAGVFSDLPVVGWIIGGLVAVARIGVTIWQAEKTRAESEIPHVSSLVYDESSDGFWSRELIAKMKESDWTDVFFPYTTGEPKSYKLIDPPSNYNRVWVIGEEQTGFGVCPGRGLLRTWNFNTPDSLNYLRTRNPIRGAYSWIRPMTAATSMQMWSRVQTKTEQAFRVLPSAIADAWTTWEDPLLPMAYKEGYSPEDTMYRARSIITPKTGGIDTPSKFRSMEARGAPTIAAFVRYQMMLLEKRQRAICDTVKVAYIPPNATALKDSSLHDHWDQRRKQLLQHTSVHRVDPRAVPDLDYRAAVIEAQANVSLPIKGAPTSDELPGAKVPPPPSLPPPEFGPGLVIPPTRKRTGSILPIAAAAAGAFFLLPKLFK